jgi:hypothetical protein
MVSILQSKDIEWQLGLKSNIQPFVAHKKHIPLTNICFEWKGGKNFSKHIDLISDKVDFKPKLLRGHKEVISY